MPGHWRVMIVSHVLRHVLLLNPFGDASEPYGFTTDEIDSVQNSYSGYNVSTCPERLQTDGWNCGVWEAWVASMWTTHVERSKSLTPGWVVYGKRRHAEPPEEDVPPQLTLYSN